MGDIQRLTPGRADYPAAAAGIAISAVLGMLAVRVFGPDLNADMVLMSVMSVQRPTLFFWGQNRYAMFFPMLLSPVKDPQLNLLLLAWLHGFAFFLLLLLVAWVIVRALGGRSFVDRMLAFLIVVAVAFLVLRRSRGGDFAVGPEPYGASYLALGVAAAVCFLRDGVRWQGWMVVTVLLLVAHGFNPSAVLVAIVIGIAAMAGGYGLRGAVFAAVSAASFALWTAVGALYPAPAVSYLGIEWSAIGGNVIRQLVELAGDVRLPIVLALAVVAGAGLAFHRREISRRGWMSLAGVACVGIGWWLAFSSNSWVRANGFAPRYFFPTYMALVIVLVAGIWVAVARLPQWVKRAAAAGLGVCLAGAALAFPFRAVPDWTAFAAVAQESAFARTSEVRYVLGDYWRAWPAVHRLLDSPDAVFGLAGRGEGNRDSVIAAIRGDLAAGKTVQAVCIAYPSSTCVYQAWQVTGVPWLPGGGACPGACELITLPQWSAAALLRQRTQ